MKKQIPRYAVMILLIFQQNSGDMDDYRNAVEMLPENLSEADREEMKKVIADYIGIKEVE
jgi:hypothetical protein